MALRGLELLDRRILAAVRFVDALGRTVREPVAVRAEPGVRHFRKPDGEIVVTGAPGLEAHAAAFAAPPSAPAVGSVPVTLDLRPAARRLAPRRAILALPRDPDPGAAQSIFAPAEVPLLPSVLAEPTGLAAALHVTVRRAGDGHLIEGALVRLERTGHPPALSVTNAGGEARLLIDAVPLASPGTGATVVDDVAGDLDAIVVLAAARFHDPADPAALAAARRVEAERREGFPDPDALLAQAALATSAQTVRVAAAQIRTATVTWSSP